MLVRKRGADGAAVAATATAVREAEVAPVRDPAASGTVQSVSAGQRKVNYKKRKVTKA